jgi:GxxExxY protein
MTENEVVKQIVDAAYRIHATLGPGLRESVYETVLAYELETRGLRIVRQQPIPIAIRTRGSRWGLGRICLWRTR